MSNEIIPAFVFAAVMAFVGYGYIHAHTYAYSDSDAQRHTKAQPDAKTYAESKAASDCCASALAARISLEMIYQ